MRKAGRAVEMTLIMFIVMPLMAFQHNLRPQTGVLSLDDTVLSDGPHAQMHSTFTHRGTTNKAPLWSASDTLLQSILMQSKKAQVRLRRRRAPSKGCQFGTCQMHNLASTLYRMGQTNNKEQSKGAGDPNGYGR